MAKAMKRVLDFWSRGGRRQGAVFNLLPSCTVTGVVHMSHNLDGGPDAHLMGVEARRLKQCWRPGRGE